MQLIKNVCYVNGLMYADYVKGIIRYTKPSFVWTDPYYL